MNHIVTFIKRLGLPVLLVVLVVAFCYTFYLFRSNPQRLQNAGVIASFAIAAVLTAVTWQYAHATEQTLELLRTQWQAQQQIHLRFGVKIQDGRARVWIRNLGASHFMVTKAVITNGDADSKTLYMHMMVHPDRRCGFNIPDSIWDHHKIFCDINVTLFYESATQPLVSKSRAYNLLLGVGRKQVIKVYRGIKEWYADCPKCKRANKTFNQLINTNGIVNFEQAAERQKEAETEFEATCPNHQSKWEATIGTVREHSRTEEVENE